jgi:hypothetical protein
VLFSKEIEPTDYRESKALYEKQIMVLEAKLSGLPENNFQNIDTLLEKTLENLCQLDKLYETGTIEQKRKIIGSIFPEKLIFDGEHYRTARVNEAVRVLFAIDKAFRQKENGTSLSFEDLSHLVIPLGLEQYLQCVINQYFAASPTYV